METTKRPRIVYLLLAAMFIVTAAVAMPTTNAKYATTKSYSINIETKLSEYFFNTTATGKKVATLPYVGRYLIIAKGGDGADGLNVDGFGTSTNYTYNISGGIGGTVYAVLETTSENTQVCAFAGSAGVRAESKNNSHGTAGGTNGTGKFSGGSGNYCTSSDSSASSSTNSCSSGGGGAATAVYLGSDNNGTLLVVAGGGGAGASWNEKWEIAGTVEAGGGGAGASMVSGATINNSPDGNGKVYYQSDSIGNGKGSTSGNSNGSFGKKGTASSGGAGGSGTVVRIVLSQIDKGRNGNAGANFANGGNGGNATCYGGGGGGGYCGGGGGTGTSIKYAAGGGGGGSSYISNLLVASDSNTANEYISTASSNTRPEPSKTDGKIPAQPTGVSGDADGYVIIVYLGPAT